MDADLRRQRYVGDAISTASPAKLVTMLYDRLVRDLQVAEAALTTRDLAAANANLTHAQEIVFELRSSLKPELWDGGPALASLYAFVLSELIAANVAKDVTKVAACRALVEPLRDAWHEAANALASQPALIDRVPATV